jgi:hypothetical protein
LGYDRARAVEAANNGGSFADGPLIGLKFYQVMSLTIEKYEFMCLPEDCWRFKGLINGASSILFTLIFGIEVELVGA